MKFFNPLTIACLFAFMKVASGQLGLGADCSAGACDAGFVCTPGGTENICVRECFSDEDCGGAICATTPATQGGTPAGGAPLARFCPTTSYPATAAAACPTVACAAPNTLCGQFTGICVTPAVVGQACTGSGQCPAGSTCNGAVTPPVCTTVCTSNVDCGSTVATDCALTGVGSAISACTNWNGAATTCTAVVPPATAPTACAIGTCNLFSYGETVCTTSCVVGGTTCGVYTCTSRINLGTVVSETYCNVGGAISQCSAATACAVTGAVCNVYTLRCSSTVTTTTAACVDRVVGGKNDCASLAALGYCANTIYYNMMTYYCPLSCSRCTGITSGTTYCVDLVNQYTNTTDCPRRAHLCGTSGYKTIMARECRATCAGAGYAGFC
uniref:ShKT domain-containing protein n=1 Tax=Rhabditophanes sp. KR3021 TaxID=114890 RepID=A0AC35UE90_9BILA